MKAKRKRVKKAPQLWVARGKGSEEVAFFKGKPSMDGTCDTCGSETYWTGMDIMDSVCWDGFEAATGLKIAEGEAVQLKVTRVEEAS